MDLKSLIVGIIVATILAVGVGVSVMAYINFASVDDARLKTKTIKQALETYYTDNDSYPETLQELTLNKYLPRDMALTNDPNSFRYEPCFTTADTNKNYAQQYILAVRIGAQDGSYYAHEARDATHSTWALSSIIGACGNATR